MRNENTKNKHIELAEPNYTTHNNLVKDKLQITFTERINQLIAADIEALKCLSKHN